MLPHLTHRLAPWFAFLLHMRDREDMFRIGASGFLRNYSEDDDDFERKIKTLPPTVVGEALFGLSTMRGELIAVLRSPDQMIGGEAVAAVRDAFQLAVGRGAKVIGLGALTSPVTNGGLMLIPDVPRGVTLTNGNAYTAIVVRDNVDEAAAFLGIGSRARVAVIGCTGSVGCATTQLLAKRGYPLLLIGRQRGHVAQICADVPGAEISEDLADAARADIVILLASNARLAPRHVRPESVVIDCCHPASIPRSLYPAFFAQQSPIVEGGFVQIPAYRSTYDAGTPTPFHTFACLAETYLFAREGIREHSVGRPSVELAEQMERAAHRHGIAIRSLELGWTLEPTATRRRAASSS